jgi:hypothetical protein
MIEPQPNDLETNFYRSYLVRFWQSNAQGDWRATAQCVQTGDTNLFRDMESLFTFLRADFGEKGMPTE